MQENLDMYYTMVEECLRGLGIEPTTAKGVNEGEWTIAKGSALIYINLKYLEKNQEVYFWVISPISDLPEETLLTKFYEELLETNHTFYGVAFTKFDNKIYMKAIREVKGIDVEEMFNIITRIGGYADMYDDVFITKYGTKLTE
ncbi:MAG: YbjN domain-containing protein [Verrucomicrobia bacterium]|nr:YbjN domain-containing protein [Cytophagales bacterium]